MHTGPLLVDVGFKADIIFAIELHQYYTIWRMKMDENGVLTEDSVLASNEGNAPNKSGATVRIRHDGKTVLKVEVDSDVHWVHRIIPRVLVPDNTPVEIPDYAANDKMEFMQQMEEFIEQKLRHRYGGKEAESLMESMDFDVGDDDDPDHLSGYEVTEMQEEKVFEDIAKSRKPHKRKPTDNKKSENKTAGTDGTKPVEQPRKVDSGPQGSGDSEGIA